MKRFLFFILSITLLANTLNSTHNLDSQTHKVYSLGKPKNLPLFPLIHYGIRDFVPTLQNGNATPEQKQRAYTALVGYISEEMGVSGTQAKLMLSKNYKGFFSHENDNIYISDNIKNSSDTVSTIGHEVSHYIDYTKDKDIEKTSEYSANRENYADLIGTSTLDYTNYGYKTNGYSALDQVLNRQNQSDISNLIKQNTFEFSTLDKTKGDTLLFLPTLSTILSTTKNANAPKDSSDISENDYPFIDANLVFSGIVSVVNGDGLEVITEFGMLRLGSKLLKPLENHLGKGIDYLKSKLGLDEKLVVGADGNYYAIKKSDLDNTARDVNNGNVVKFEGNGKTPDYIKDNRKLIDSDTVLVDKTKYTKIGRTGPKGSQIYKDKNGNYYHRDTLHVGKGAELEVYDKSGKHIGTADPSTGILDTTKKVAGRNIKKYL